MPAAISDVRPENNQKCEIEIQRTIPHMNICKRSYLLYADRWICVDHCGSAEYVNGVSLGARRSREELRAEMNVSKNMYGRSFKNISTLRVMKLKTIRFRYMHDW